MRKKIVNIIIKHQEELVENLRKSLETYETTTDLDEESSIDLDDKSHQADVQEMKNRIEEKLVVEQKDLSDIKSLADRESSEIREGAVVQTDECFYFIGFAFAPIHLSEMQIYGVERDAPAFVSNKGKKKGDEMILGNEKQKILNIY